MNKYLILSSIVAILCISCTNLNIPDSDSVVAEWGEQSSASLNESELSQSTIYSSSIKLNNGSSSSSAFYSKGESITYLGEVYETIVISSQTWMSRNLNATVDSSSFCYGDDEMNCNTYGRLYDWSTAMGIASAYNFVLWNGSTINVQGICPDNWHIPNYDEWDKLQKLLGQDAAGIKLKAKIDWPNGDGDNVSGLNILPAGYSINGVYSKLHQETRMWISGGAQSDTEQWGWYCGIESSARYIKSSPSYIALTLTSKTDKLSVRCLHN